MSDIADWYYKIPFFTRWWLTLTIAFSLAGRFGLVRMYSMVLLYEPLMNNYEIWRPITAIFYYPITPMTGFRFLVNLYFLYSYSLRLESSDFSGRPADYFYMLIFNWICCVVVALLIQLPLLMDALILCVLYIWCQLHKDVIVNFWFGTRFKAMYLPWVLFGFNFILAGAGISDLIGILCGHLYYFLKFIYPQESGGRSFLQTPNFLYNWFPNVSVSSGFGTVPTQPQQQRPRGHNWGRGEVLGGN